MVNRTVHAVMHTSWVPDGAGGHHGQMAVLVKPNGLFGRAYMAAIAPIRYLIVYPTMQSDQHVLGWAIRYHTPESVLLAAGSPGGLQTELLVEHRQGTLLFACFSQQDGDEARAQWAAVEHVHTPAMRRLVDEAVARATPPRRAVCRAVCR